MGEPDDTLERAAAKVDRIADKYGVPRHMAREIAGVMLAQEVGMGDERNG